MESLTNSVTEHEHHGMRFFAARTGAKDVVSIEGSVHGGHYLLHPSKNMVPRLVTGILDAGTKHRSKNALREGLAARGASLEFSAAADRTYFYASCLPEDVGFICSLIAECLSEALLENREFEQERTRVLAEIDESKTDTAFLAAEAFTRLTFDPKHVNYADPIAREIERVRSTKRADLVSFTRSLGRGGLVFAITGDIAPEASLRDAKRAFSKLPTGITQLPAKPRNTRNANDSQKLVAIPDKANIDTFMGAPVALTYNDPLYLPFMSLLSMLGGGGIFVGHLMRTIRERDGYTYGIYTRPYGFEGGADGAMRISASFSPQSFDVAVAATRKEIKNFFTAGITENALQTQKDNAVGSYVIGMSTTRGLAGALHKIGREGKPLSYLDEYPALVRAVTIADLQSAAALIELDKLSLAAAGTFL